MVNEELFPPPPPKTHVGVRRGQKINYSRKIKAERAATKVCKEKIDKNQKKLKVLQRKTYATKKTIDENKQLIAITEQKSALITKDALDKAPEEILDVFNGREIIFRANPGPQTDFLAAPEREVFYGGARGGGKSYAMLIDPLRYCDKAAHRALIIRRTMPELRDLIEHSRRLYSRAFPGAKFREQEKEWRFKSGARIEFGFAENRTDALRYQGQAYTWIGIDELPQYPTPDIWNDLRGSLRTADPSIPLFLRASGNPGNIGSHWVREMFITPAPWGQPFEVEIDTPLGKKKVSRRFIQAKLADNPYLMQTDDYLIMLASLPEIQRKQWLEGNWDVFENAAFSEFDKTKHVVTPFKIPGNWTKFRSADWGYSSPACVLWMACDEDNNLWVYRELYAKGLTADIFARKVLELECDDKNLRYGVLDASTWAKRGDVGPSIAETMIREGCSWRMSDRSAHSRINGKLEVHRRLQLNKETKKPTIFIFSTCANLIRTLPQLPLNPDNMEDVDDRAEDHAYDAFRYGCMSRPINISQYNIIAERIRAQKHTVADKVFGY